MRRTGTWMRMRAAAIVVAAGAFGVAMVGTARGPSTRCRLSEAIVLALEKNEDIVIERESVAAAEAEVNGARRAPTTRCSSVDGTWWQQHAARRTPPSPARPPGSSRPTSESTEAGVGLRQLLPDRRRGGGCGRGGSRDTTDGTFSLLSPAYGTQLGVELRQPLLRDRAHRHGAARDPGRDGRPASAPTPRCGARSRTRWRRRRARVLDAGRRARESRCARRRSGSPNEQLAETETRDRGGDRARDRDRAAARRARAAAGRAVRGARGALARAENSAEAADPRRHRRRAVVGRTRPGRQRGRRDRTRWTSTARSRRRSPSGPSSRSGAAEIGAEAETAFAKDGVRPALDAVVSYDRFGLAGDAEPGTAPRTADLRPQVEGDWGESFGTRSPRRLRRRASGWSSGYRSEPRPRRGGRRSAKSVERQAEAELARTRKAIRAEVLDAAAALETASQRIEATRAGREAAEVQLSAERDRFAAGLSTNFLVLTRQNDLSRGPARRDLGASPTTARRAPRWRAPGIVARRARHQVSTEEND